MNPNLDFGQAVPGQRGPTTIETTRLVAVVEAIGLLQGSDALTPAVEQGLETWFGRYVDWMTGPQAPGDRLKPNNWSLSYDLQLAEFALFARRAGTARAVLERVPHDRLAVQIAADGSLPAETARAQGLSYSLFAVGLLLQLADLGRCVDVDLWSAPGEGAGIRAALDYLIPFVGHEERWPFTESKDPRTIANVRRHFRRLLLKAAWTYREPRYFAAAAALAGAAERGWPVPAPDYLE